MSKRFLMLSIVVVVILTAAITAYYTYSPNAERVTKFRAWMSNPASRPDWKLGAGSRCGSAPFLFPTDGFAGFLWGDSFGLRHTHQGIDIFAGTDVGIIRVVSAYPGYLTRLPEWKSAVIVRVPSDPLNPGEQIWLYYTHMADRYGNSFISEEFPAGTSEKFVEAGAFFDIKGITQATRTTLWVCICIFPLLKMMALDNSRTKQKLITRSTPLRIWVCR